MAEEAIQPGCWPAVESLDARKGSAGRERGCGAGPSLVDKAGNRLPATAKRIVIIDERIFRRECVVRMLREVAPPEYSIVALECARDPLADAGADEGAENVDVVIMDIGWMRLPDDRVAADVRFLQERFREVPIILLSDREDSSHVAKALSYGVRGFIPTSLDVGVVAEVVQLVGAGGTFVPASALVDALSGYQDGTGGGRGSAARAARLTPRECEVLNLLREGKPNKIIAAALDLKETTVKIHVRHIMKKLKATNRTEAALMAERAL